LQAGEEIRRMAIDDPDLKYANYECFILAVSVLSLANLVYVIVLPQGEMAEIIRVVDVGLSLVLLLDFFRRGSIAPSRSSYFLRDYGWLDLIGSLPIQFLRVARLYRVITVSRSLQPVRTGLWRTVLRDRAGSTLFAVLFLVALLLEVASSLVLAVEIQAPDSNIKTSSDALWWTWVSVMTVGYGDRFPVTDTGRWVGVVTISVGVGLFGALTGFLTNAFIRPASRAEREAREREAWLRLELDELRQELRSMRSPRGDGDSAVPPTPPTPSAAQPIDGAR